MSQDYAQCKVHQVPMSCDEKYQEHQWAEYVKDRAPVSLDELAELRHYLRNQKIKL